MIDFFFGKPRSGKSYRAMKLIYDLYIVNKEEPKFRNILTNIGGFKFDKVNQMFLDKGSPNKAYNLSWKSFYVHLKKMYEMALDEKSDEELNKYADYHMINDCLIVLDEASLYMKKYDDVISWWLAYHGHFKVRIVIITQGPKQINPEYMTHTEIYYEAQPQSKQLRDNQLRYIHHSDIPFNKDSKFSSDTITTSKDIYSLYKSGEVDKPKKIVYKYIIIFVLAFSFVIFAFYTLFSRLGGSHPSVEDVNPSSSNKSSVTPSVNPFDSPTVSSFDLINLRCNNQWCWNGDNKFQDNSISLNYFKNLVIQYKIELFYHEVKAEIYSLTPIEKTLAKKTLAKLTDYYYLVSPDVKKKYLSALFILKKPISKKPNTSLFSNKDINPFNTESEAVSRSDERLSEE
jgi:zona occludens toxin